MNSDVLKSWEECQDARLMLRTAEELRLRREATLAATDIAEAATRRYWPEESKFISAVHAARRCAEDPSDTNIAFARTAEKSMWLMAWTHGRPTVEERAKAWACWSVAWAIASALGAPDAAERAADAAAEAATALTPGDDVRQASLAESAAVVRSRIPGALVIAAEKQPKTPPTAEEAFSYVRTMYRAMHGGNR